MINPVRQLPAHLILSILKRPWLLPPTSRVRLPEVGHQRSLTRRPPGRAQEHGGRPRKKIYYDDSGGDQLHSFKNDLVASYTQKYVLSSELQILRG